MTPRLYTSDEVREMLIDVFTAGWNAPRNPETLNAYREAVVAMTLDPSIGATLSAPPPPPPTCPPSVPRP
jgi:hypothetical protein